MRPSLLKPFGVSVGLSALFLVVYGVTNWIASQRTGVGSIAFVWERQLPFVPIFIVPYLSIDLLFVVAPFLCQSTRELSTLAKRIAAAILAAGVCFLIIPFRFAFGRPLAAGWLGPIFDWFRGMDAPFNLFPSLHITLSALLVATYARHTRGVLRIACVIWFGLIAASAVLTFQHHFLDVVGGFALAGYCFYFIREDHFASSVRIEKRIGAYYATGAVLTLILAVWLWPWGALLLWPTTSLAITASAYFGRGPGVFRKTAGRLPWSTRWALGPILVGQHLSRIYYRRQCRAWDAVTPRVWIGSALHGREAREAVRAGVNAVLDLTAEFSAPPAFRKLVYLNLPILDLTAPNLAQLEEMARFISREAERGVVYVHCKIGYSRSAAAVAAYLLRSGGASSVTESLSRLRTARPSIVVRPEVERALVEFEQNMRKDFVLASNEPSPF